MKKTIITLLVLAAILVVLGIIFKNKEGTPTPESLLNNQETEEQSQNEQDTSRGDEGTTSEGEVQPATSMDEGALQEDTGGSANTSTAPASGETTTSRESSNETASEEEQSVTEITYTGNGFSPENVTVTAGDRVRWVNESGTNMWVASDVHPSHTEYNGTSINEHCNGGGTDAFDQCESGATYSFTFDKTGEWGYHNHASASDTGTITVTE